MLLPPPPHLERATRVKIKSNNKGQAKFNRPTVLLDVGAYNSLFNWLLNVMRLVFLKIIVKWEHWHLQNVHGFKFFATKYIRIMWYNFKWIYFICVFSWFHLSRWLMVYQSQFNPQTTSTSTSTVSHFYLSFQYMCDRGKKQSVLGLSVKVRASYPDLFQSLCNIRKISISISLHSSTCSLSFNTFAFCLVYI